MANEQTLRVLANGALVGEIKDEAGVWSFQYAEEWLTDNQRFTLSPAFPLDMKPVVDGSTRRPVQWFFDNLLPEEGMRTALAREAKVDTADAWGLLEFYGRESAGALTLIAPGDDDGTGDLVPLTYEALEARIQKMPEQPLTHDAPKRMSAAGAQQKLLVVLERDESNFRLSEPKGTAPSTHILKPDMRHTGYPHSAINEFFCMTLARELGLDVPDTHFIRVPSACYVIKRFDRDDVTTPPGRVHVVDATQLLNLDKSFKYREANATSLQSCIQMLGPQARARAQIFRWAVINLLVGNGDAHLKNISFFSRTRGFSLAPFYDIVSTVVYNTPTYREGAGSWLTTELAMTVGQATHFEDINRGAVIKFGQDIGLTDKNGARMLDLILADLAPAVTRTREIVGAVAVPSAGEARLLNAIEALPLREVAQALAE